MWSRRGVLSMMRPAEFCANCSFLIDFMGNVSYDNYSLESIQPSSLSLSLSLSYDLLTKCVYECNKNDHLILLIIHLNFVIIFFLKF